MAIQSYAETSTAVARLIRQQRADQGTTIQSQIWIGRCPGREGFDLPAVPTPSRIEELDEGDPESTVLPNLERYPGGEVDRLYPPEPPFVRVETLED